MFRTLHHILRPLAVAAALIAHFGLEPQSATAAPNDGRALTAAGTTLESAAASARPVDGAAAAAGGYRFPLGLKACALSVGTAIAGLAMVSVAPLGALNAFTAGMLSMLYTCS